MLRRNLPRGGSVIAASEASDTESGVSAVSEDSDTESGVSAVSEDTTILDSGTCGDNLTWTLDSDYALTIPGTGAMTDWEKDGESYPHTPWYSYRESITSVTIDDGVTTIGEYAFYNCTGMTSVDIPNSVISIGKGAFYGCKSLTGVTIPDSVTSIGSYAFRGCTGMTGITADAENSAYSSLDGVLFNKDQTELVCYPGGKTGEYVIPDSVTAIGDYAFVSCSGLTSVTIPDSVTSIGECAFSNCSSLTSVTIPDSVTSIGDYAFHYCKGLTSVTIGNGVTSIGNL